MVCPYQVSQIIIFFLLHYIQLMFFFARSICRHNSEHFDGQGTEAIYNSQKKGTLENDLPLVK